MENFWDSVLDVLLLLLKVIGALVVIRVLLWVIGVNIVIPYLDPFLQSIYAYILGVVRG